MEKVSYQLFSPENSHVDVLQRAVIVLKHLSRPQSAVYVSPLILPDVQQPAPLLKPTRRVTGHPKTFFTRVEESPSRFLTHIGVLVSILQTQNALPVVANPWRRGELWAVFSI